MVSAHLKKYEYVSMFIKLDHPPRWKWNHHLGPWIPGTAEFPGRCARTIFQVKDGLLRPKSREVALKTSCKMFFVVHSCETCPLYLEMYRTWRWYPKCPETNPHILVTLLNGENLFFPGQKTRSNPGGNGMECPERRWWGWLLGCPGWVCEDQRWSDQWVISPQYTNRL